ncbi:hypothetical protein AAEU32_11620 [Pseudoalteromonas sp. SSDWG2]|uniref:hypothetical protein n=1 Tax=Pseudoalteromonas sp. SSDWG2 TaxID=3139391 RepID=UPI003BAB6703
MKKVVLLVLFTLAIGTLLLLFKPSDKPAERVHSALSNEAVATTVLALNTHKPKTQFKATPFPQDTPSKDECAGLNRRFYEQHHEHNNALIQQATIAWQQGYSIDEVSHALLVQGADWSVVGPWRDKAMNFEATSQLKDTLIEYLESHAIKLQDDDENKYIKELIADNIERLSTLPSRTQVEDGIPRVSSTHYLYRSLLDVDVFEQQLLNDPVSFKLTDITQDITADVPPALLNSAELSPLHNFFMVMMMTGHTQAATLLTEKYPQAFDNKSIFVSELQMLALLHLQVFAPSPHDTELRQRLINAMGLQRSPLYLSPNNPGAMEIDLALLASKGVNLGIEPISALAQQVSALDLTIDTPAFLNDQELKLQQACVAQNDWLDARSLPVAQWHDYEDSEFVAEVTASPEYAYCLDAPTRSNEEINRDAFLQLMSLNKPLGELQRLELDNLDLAGMSQDDITTLALTLTSMATSDDLPRSEIVNRLTNAGLVVNIESAHTLAAFAGTPELDAWLNQIGYIPENTALHLANAAAHRGNLPFYKKIEPYLARSNQQHLDPLYFSLTTNNSFVHRAITDNQNGESSFLGYLFDRGQEVQPYHLRAMMKMKVQRPEIYEQIVEQHPQLVIHSVDEYFAVKCE